MSEQSAGEVDRPVSTDGGESGLQDRLKRVEYDTLDGDSCRGEIVGIEEVRGDVRVTVELPSGREHTERFDLPEAASDKYEFVRLLGSAGYGLSAVDHAVGADVKVNITDEGPEIAVPDPDRSLIERFVEAFPQETVVGAGFFVALAAFPLTGVYILRAYGDELLFDDPVGVFFGWMFYFMGLVLWGLTFGLAALWLVGLVV